MACQAKNQRGEPCKAPEIPGREWCFWHDPERSKARQKARRKGGLSVHYGSGGGAPREVSLREVGDFLELLEIAAGDVLGRKPSLQRARALAYLATVGLRVLEAGSLEERVAALEQRLTMAKTA
jgi:hypothetical protein